MANVHNLERIDTNPIPAGVPECRAVVKILNEIQRLPWLLDYYRSLGVSRFFIVDNGSADGSVEFLLRQKDCHVFSTDAPMSQANSGSAWQQEILDRYGENCWWLVLDADEMFVYPESETVPLPVFCRYLDRIGARGVSAFMLDMYSKGPVAEAVYQSGHSFLEICPYFDAEYDFWPRPQHLRSYSQSGHSVWRLRSGHAPQLFPAMEPVGGPRLRLFYPQYRKAGLLKMIRMKATRHLRDRFRPYGIKIKSFVPPVLFKVPLVKAGEGLRLLDCHSVSPIPLAPVTGALLHFKFFSDFHERVVDAVRRGQHFDGASEYARYLEASRLNPRLSFYYEKSLKYEGSRHLASCGLIKDDSSFADYRGELPKK